MANTTLRMIQNRIEAFPRIALVHRPTPIQRLENLSRELGGPEIFIKRDDLTGLAFGGNKSRKLEFILPDVLGKKAGVIITWASLQSNWCLQTAAAARKLGLKAVLVLFKTYDLPEEWDGNLLLDFILEAEIRFHEADKGQPVPDDVVQRVIRDVKHEVQERGQIPYVAPIGGSMPGWSMDKPLGAIAYMEAFVEAVEQAESMGMSFDYLVHATGSGGTQAGLVAGVKALGGQIRVCGVSVSEDKDVFGRDVLDIAEKTIKALDLNVNISEEDVFVLDDYLGEGYGHVNQDVADAIRMVAVQEAIFLDPVYTGKAMAGLIDQIKQGRFKKDEKILFIHTGGTAALFPNKHRFRELLRAP